MKLFGFFVYLLCATSVLASEYKFITNEFSTALAGITAASAFENIPDEPISSLDPDEIQPSLRPNGRIATTSTWVDSVCEPLKDAYIKIIGNGIRGTQDVYDFNNELIKVMRGAGAYPLPIRLMPGSSINAVYFKPGWEKMTLPQDYEEITKIQRLAREKFLDPALKFDEDGIKFNFEYETYQKQDVRTFLDTHIFATNDAHLELRKFGYALNIIQPFLFVLKKNPADINQESIYLYLNFYFSIVGNEYSKIETLKIPSAGKVNFNCNVLSKTGLAFRLSNLENQNVLPSVYPFEPLTIPLYVGYEGGPKPFNGKKLRNPYEIKEEDVAEPSLKCWMLALGFFEGDTKHCLNTGYAIEFKNMLNSGICVKAESVEPFPSVSYPYKVLQPGNHNPSYLGNRASVSPKDTEINPCNQF